MKITDLDKVKALAAELTRLQEVRETIQNGRLDWTITQNGHGYSDAILNTRNPVTAIKELLLHQVAEGINETCARLSALGVTDISQ